MVHNLHCACNARRVKQNATLQQYICYIMTKLNIALTCFFGHTHTQTHTHTHTNTDTPKNTRLLHT
jgi:hypothetical protein